MRISDWSSDVCSSDLPDCDVAGIEVQGHRARWVDTEVRQVLAVERLVHGRARRVERQFAAPVAAGHHDHGAVLGALRIGGDAGLDGGAGESAVGPAWAARARALVAAALGTGAGGCPVYT